jgi:hypothetical protein
MEVDEIVGKELDVLKELAKEAIVVFPLSTF